MRIDQVALLPAYLAAGTALLAFLTDLVVGGRRTPVVFVTLLGALATAAGAIGVATKGDRQTFCLAGAGCSYQANHRAALIATLFALLTAAVLALSWSVLDELPAGEFCFLLATSMAGGVVLGYAGDLITLVVALETLTLPLYILVGLRRGVPGAEGAVTFFVISVVSTSFTLLGAALLYATTGAVHFSALRAALAGNLPAAGSPLAKVGAVVILAGLAFKVAAVPFHAWAPATYDGAPVAVAAYLSTASKVGGVIAILYVAINALGPSLAVVGPALAILAVATMTVGNLAALRQQRLVRLLAWSSIAQVGYLLAPLGALALARARTPGLIATAVAATLAYTVFYVVLELGAFGAVIALRGGVDGGRVADLAGTARRAPWAVAALLIALAGLAGLPPGLAGLFAKVVVVRSLLSGGAAWLAIVVALNAVVGLAYYVRAGVAPFAPGPGARSPGVRAGWPALWALGVVTAAAVVLGFAPQLVLDAVH
jgi:NADH-quinone oxidoreductase subunit N